MFNRQLFFSILFLSIFFSTLFAQDHTEGMQLAELSLLAYSDSEKLQEKFTSGILYDFIKWNTLYDKNTGFAAIAYANKAQQKLMIAYRGTDDTQDVLSDLAIANITVFNNKEKFASEIINDVLEEMIVPTKFPYLYKSLQVNSLAFAQSNSGNIFEKIQSIDPNLAIEFRSNKSFWEEYLKKITRRINFLQRLQKISLRFNGQSKAEKYLQENIKSAEEFFLDSKKMAKIKWGIDFQVYITGHSLGGGYAQIIGAKHTIPTQTFAAPGMQEVFAKYLGNIPKNTTHIENHIHEHDLVTKVGKHIGRIRKYRDPLLNTEQQQKRTEKLIKFGEDVVKDMKKSLHKDLRHLKVLKKNIDFAIQRVQKQESRTPNFFKKRKENFQNKIEQLKYIKIQFDILEKLLNIPPNKRLQYIEKNNCTSKYNREEIVKLQFAQLLDEVLYNHSMANYCITFRGY